MEQWGEGSMQRCRAEEVGLKKARDHLPLMARSTAVRGVEAYLWPASPGSRTSPSTSAFTFDAVPIMNIDDTTEASQLEALPPTDNGRHESPISDDQSDALTPEEAREHIWPTGSKSVTQILEPLNADVEQVERVSYIPDELFFLSNGSELTRDSLADARRGE